MPDIEPSADPASGTSARRLNTLPLDPKHLLAVADAGYMAMTPTDTSAESVQAASEQVLAPLGQRDLLPDD